MPMALAGAARFGRATHLCGRRGHRCARLWLPQPRGAGAFRATECRARNSQVIHGPSGRSSLLRSSHSGRAAASASRCGEGSAERPEGLYCARAAPIPHLDIPDKVKGAARFGLDVRLPGMVYAVVAQCPYLRGDLLRFDAGAAKAVPGVIDVFEIPTDPDSANKDTREVAVIAANTWAAIQGRNALAAEWKAGQYHDESTESLTAQLRGGPLRSGILELYQYCP